MTVDRIDNNSDYKPGNIKWSTRTEQQRNNRHPKHTHRRGKGIYWYSSVNAWGVAIRHEGKLKHFGRFTSKKEAKLDYLSALKALGLKRKP